MLPDRVSNPVPLTYESGVLPIALRGPDKLRTNADECVQSDLKNFSKVGRGCCGYETDSYGFCGCDTDTLWIDRIDTDGPSIASVYVCDLGFTS